MAQGYQGVPPGPLSAYLGVRGSNEAADMEKFGMLARIQQAEQARKMQEALRRDQLEAQVEGRKEAIASRELLAGQAATQQKEMVKMRLESQENNAKMTHQFRMAGLKSDAERNAETSRHNKVMEDIAKLRAAAGRGAKPPTEGQLVSSGYADRMVASEKIMEGLTTSANPITGKPGVIESMAATLPLVGKLGSNVARSPERQKYRQAQEDWVRAKLRKESGAVIADEEMDREIRVYFPQLGDSPEVIQQKKESRKVAQAAMIRAAAGGSGTAKDTAPEGVDPKVWAVMTPEEKALWPR